jgi:spoIIIJ-associated protein
MDWIEVSAKTLDDAKELALDRLGVVEDELEYEVIDEPKGGLFGLGRSDARIRARVKPLSREKPADRRRRRGRSASPSRSGGNGAAGEPAARSGSGGGRSRGGRNRGGGSSSPARARTTGAPSRTDETHDNEGQAEVSVETMPVSTQAEHAARFADELVRTMGFTAEVKTEVEEDDVTVSIEGDALGVLVGPKGATLQALEEVVRAVVQHHAGGHSARVHVDVGGYRARRREALAAFATQIAESVRDSSAPKALEPMNASDRKVVHDVVSEIEGVVTHSEGEDPRRRVVISPA